MIQTNPSTGSGQAATTTTYFVGNYYIIPEGGEVTGGVVTKYYYAGSQRIAMRKNGTLNYIIGDHLGSTSLVTDAAGVVVSQQQCKAWGETRYTSGSEVTRYQYTGQYSDSYINLLDYGSRRYDPELGRFIQPDSIVPLASQGVQAYDRYGYVNNNPVRYNDPTGYAVPSCAICAIWNSVASSWNSYWKSKNADGYGGPQAWDHNRRQSEAKNKFYDKNVNCTSGWQCVAGLMDRAYYQEDHAVITGKGLELLAKDPRLLNLQDEIEYSATKDPRYGKQDFTRPPVSGRSITFGDEGGGMLKDATHPQTWMVRAATVDADIYVTKAKEIYINYQVYDVLDLRPDWGSKERNDSGYNIATHVLGQIWHDQLGASDQMNIYAQWIAVIK